VEELQAENALFFAIYNKEEAVGFFKLESAKAFGRRAECPELERITRTRRGKGIGTPLHPILNLAWKKRIVAETMDTSPAAVGFTRGRGFWNLRHPPGKFYTKEGKDVACTRKVFKVSGLRVRRTIRHWFATKVAV